ncbi:DUF2079 domain-containing protein [Candidatus Viridilinea mediisalina]|uniref:DUF2079 domain-containing protein n=1 Tax=Candidatus Viridilinea mediisalina TaxID=2024553 RepID=A0A2A6REG9_9CHLR|nr:DUF2079 domain-containing protein [Candidatus Viridilinea mediisalina]PDW01514.1 hypothetical protein CJ255_18775 [Candidatus Viridilinea mediisalina]
MQPTPTHHPIRAPLLWLAMFVVGTMLTMLSLARYWGYNAGMLDLGNMAQAIASVLRGEPLVFTFVDGPYSRLALHVEIFYFLLAPLWAIWPDPQVLLLFQAVLYALGAIPAYRLGMRATNDAVGGLCLSLIYLCYPVAQTAVLFDFHGDTLAMPLLVFALDALDRRAWWAYAIWIGLALSCKFYVAVPVALLGAVVALQPETRRVGLTTAMVALLYGILAFLVIRPIFTTETSADSQAGLNYIRYYFGAIDQLRATWLERLLTLLIVFGPALFVAWRGWRWLLPAVPLAFAALISTGPGGSFDYRYHHYAIVTPFVVMATAAGLRQIRISYESGQTRRRWYPDAIFSAGTVLLFSALLVNQPLNPLFWLAPYGYGLDHSVYGVIPRDQVKDRFLAEHVPPKAPLAASMFLAPRLVDRETLYVVRYADDPGGERLPRLLPQVDYVLADGLFDWRRIVDGRLVGGTLYERAEIAILLNDPAFDLVAARDGLLFFQRAAPPAAVLTQELELPAQATHSEPKASFGPISLLHAEITQVAGRRYRASFEWRLDGTLPERDWFAVSQLGERDDARFVHLPSVALQPITTWQVGQVVREQFELVIPDDIPAGSYAWQVAWYDPAHPEAALSDPRALVAGSEPLLLQELVVEGD